LAGEYQQEGTQWDVKAALKKEKRGGGRCVRQAVDRRKSKSGKGEKKR